MNNNQFKVSIIQHIDNMYGNVMRQYQQLDVELKLNPRSHSIKAEWAKYLALKQQLEALIHHIDDGSYESEEFYTMYLNPKTRFKQ